MFKYVCVLVDVPLGTKTFSYLIPSLMKGKIAIGQALLVPFGKRIIKAYAVGFSNYLDASIKAKEVHEILDFEPLFNLDYLKVLEWVADYYFCDIQTVFKAVIPNKFFQHVKSKTENILIFKTFDNATMRQKNVLEILKNNNEITASDFIKIAKTTYATLKKLESSGCIDIQERKVFRNPNAVFSDIAQKKNTLNPMQQKVFEEIYKKGCETPFLIHGVTGSGKTEVYFELMEKTIRQGKNVLFLAPEIAIVSQLTRRAAERFGNDAVSIWHSSISDGEKYDVWQKLKNNEIKILMGARSAVFAPLKNIGLIVIDEEHDSSYKQTMPSPRYDARKVAQKLAKLYNAKLIYGSATPDVVTYYHAKKNNALFELKNRHNDVKLAKVYIVDMKHERIDGNNGIFSRAMIKNLDANLKDGKQSILLLNRRGYSTYTQCMECGETIMCPKCAIPLIWHEASNSHKCHYCGFEDFHIIKCTACASDSLQNFGTGVQKVETITKKIFENATIARLDSDSLSHKNEHIKILESFQKGEIDILIGTQMIAKGLDNPNVTFVGVINADTNFNLPDYRSTERGFSLLMQVAGRAGRGDFEGRVIFQTYNDGFNPLLKAREQDYISFWENEIALRAEFYYPPYSQIIRVVISAENNFRAERSAQEIDLRFKSLIENRQKEDKITVFDSSPCIFERIRGEYRFNILIKNKDGNEGHSLITSFLRSIKLPADVKIVVDIDPCDIL